MTHNLKIALCGKMRTGKDTVGEYLVQKYGMFPFSFGKELKKQFHEKYPSVSKDPKPHRGYQLYGQLMRYVHGDDYWVDKCFRDIRAVENFRNHILSSADSGLIEFKHKLKTPPVLPVITDLRQQNELDRCVKEGFTIVRINSEESLRFKRMSKGEELSSVERLEDLSNFETETGIDELKDVDYDIDNSSSLEELYKKIDNLVYSIRVTNNLIDTL